MCCVANLWGGGWVGVGCRPCQPRPLENRLGFIQTSQRETGGDAAIPPPSSPVCNNRPEIWRPNWSCRNTHNPLCRDCDQKTLHPFGYVDLSTALLLLQLLIIRIFTLYGTKKNNTYGSVITHADVILNTTRLVMWGILGRFTCFSALCSDQLKSFYPGTCFWHFGKWEVGHD